MQNIGIEKEIIISTLLYGKELYYAEIQNVPFREGIEKRYKLIYKISSRYSLIIIAIYEQNILKVVNTIKTSKGAEKLWRKKILK